MKWAVPEYTNEIVDAAGQTIASKSQQGSVSLECAYNILNNWRSSHAFPLNTMQMYLRRKSQHEYARSLVAQRIKRLSSIEAKLLRFKWLKLSEMQDTGGCRAIVRSAKQVENLVEEYRTSRIRHKLVRSDDYINNPKKSGYRGHHLIYRYRSDKNTTYNDLKIEIQIRSSLQHTWATAVETVGTFTQQALKSSQGEQDWLRFFALMGSLFAKREVRPLVPGTPVNQPELLEELTYYARKLDVIERLNAYRVALEAITEGRVVKGRYFLLVLDIQRRTVEVHGFRYIEEASQAYLDAERRISVRAGNDAVLVSVESLESLKRAYPNYFLDADQFRHEVLSALLEVRIKKGA